MDKANKLYGLKIERLDITLVINKNSEKSNILMDEISLDSYG